MRQSRRRQPWCWSWRFPFTLAVLMLSFLAGCASGGTGTGSTPTPTLTPTPTPTPVPFSVTSVDLVVTPTSIAGKTCGTSLSLTYTATFHLPAGTAGGTIQFAYTHNNGRSSGNASVTVSPGQTSATYTFTTTGNIGPAYDYPGVAEVMVTSPNAVNSPQVQIAGSCV